MKRLVMAAVGLGLVVVFGSPLLPGCATGAGERNQPTETAAPPTAEAATATSTSTNEVWDKVIPVNRSQTRDGLQLTLEGIALGTPSKMLDAKDQEVFGETYPNSKSVLAVKLEAYNTAATTSSLPVYTSTTALVNDEQVGMDMTLSDVETEILSGAKKDMTAIFIVTRYTSSEIHTVRFVLQKTISFTLPESETTYDFTVQVP
jgi:hypothetical protein